MPLYPPATTTGYTPGGTDVAVADGGTGASTASGARTNLGVVIGTDVRAQGSGDPTSLAASVITVADAGSLLTATEVETALQELALKGIGYSAHGNTGSTETFSALTGWHSATLNANCTFTLTAAPSSTASQLFLELLQDGTGGWAITLPASVTNKTALEAAQVTTLSTTSFLGLWSRDGGTTWYGAWVGAASASGSVATDTIWDAKGDLAAGTGADTAAKRTVGADDTILMADSAQSTGLKWVASQTPSTQAFSDAAAQGTADTYARGDHKHGMPASPGGGGLARSTLGTTSAGGSFRTARANYLKKITLAADGFLASVVVHVKGNSSGGTLGAAVWTDSAGAPVLVIAAVNPPTDKNLNESLTHIIDSTARWVTVPVMAYLSAGDYWIGAILSAGADSRIQIAYSAGTGSDKTQTIGTVNAVAEDISLQATSTTTDDHSIYANILS